MKKSSKNILLILFISIGAYLGYNIATKISYKKKVAQNIKTIPKFSYLDINEKAFTNEDLKTITPTIFIYFNTECEYCNEEAKMIKDNIERLKKFQLIFISFEKAENITSFAQKYQLTNYDNIHFLCDDKVTFASTFDVNALPSIVLYDKEQNLIEKIKGQIKATTLIKKMNSK